MIIVSFADGVVDSFVEGISNSPILEMNIEWMAEKLDAGFELNMTALTWTSRPVDVCVRGFQLHCLSHSSHIPDGLVSFTLPSDSTVELGWQMCHGLYSYNLAYVLPGRNEGK